MKVLIRHETNASHYIYSGIAAELQKRGNTVAFWCPEQKSCFDIFNEFNPDVYLGQGYNLDRAQIKNLNTRPSCKIFLKCGNYGSLDSEIDTKEYPVLMATDNERKAVDSIVNKDRICIFNFNPNTDKWNDAVIGKWRGLVPTIFGLAPAADTSVFYPEPKNDKLRCDLVICSAIWEYKQRTISKYIFPLCYPLGKYNIRIFGSSHWSQPQYIGAISDSTLRGVLSSAKLGLHVSEPHLQRWGYEVISRIPNTLACGTLCISDYVAALDDYYPNLNFPAAKTPEEYKDMIDYYLVHDEERIKLAGELHKYTLEHHTYENRVDEIFTILEI